MLLNDTMNGIGNYLNVSGDVIAFIVSACITVTVMVAVSHTTEITGLVLLLLIFFLVAVFVIVGWMPAWILLAGLIMALAYIFFTGEDIKGIGQGLSRR